jgi:hypothetical protein
MTRLYDTIKTVANKYTWNNTHTLLKEKKIWQQSFEKSKKIHQKKGHLF